jgi:hypothetical protein
MGNVIRFPSNVTQCDCGWLLPVSVNHAFALKNAVLDAEAEAQVEHRTSFACPGKGAKATRAGRPWKMVYVYPMLTSLSKSDALKHEAKIKKLTRAEKEKLFR